MAIFSKFSVLIDCRWGDIKDSNLGINYDDLGDQYQVWIMDELEVISVCYIWKGDLPWAVALSRTQEENDQELAEFKQKVGL